MAVKWQDVDLDAGTLRVRASLQRVGSEIQLLDPKTDRARRTVGIPLATITLLRRHRLDQNARRLLLGAAWTDLHLLIDNGDGGPIPPDSISRDFYRLTRKLELPNIRFHDLRHYYATALLSAGVHPKVTSEALGHSSVAFTMDTYQHLMPSMQESATRAIQDALGGVIAPAAE